MALRDITEKILADAQGRAKDIAIKSEEESKDLKKKSEEKLREIAKEQEVAVLRQIKEIERSSFSIAQHGANMSLETEKRKAVDRVFSLALEGLLALPEKEYQLLISKHIKSLPKLSDAVFIVPEERLRVTKEVFSDVGVSGEVNTTKEFKGGYKVSSSTFEINMSFEHLLKDSKSNLEIDVARILFKA